MNDEKNKKETRAGQRPSGEASRAKSSTSCNPLKNLSIKSKPIEDPSQIEDGTMLVAKKKTKFCDGSIEKKGWIITVTKKTLSYYRMFWIDYELFTSAALDCARKPNG